MIGLGTGTMASYGIKGQRVDFYDIDPVVVDISYDTNEFFHFIEDAEARRRRRPHPGRRAADVRPARLAQERKKIIEAAGEDTPPAINEKVTQKRLLPLHKRPWHKGHLWFARMDRDNDGYVSWKEFVGTDEEFKAIDADGDGQISESEARAFKPKPPERFGPELASDVKYRLIVVDAFSSDAIPVHLITRQACRSTRTAWPTTACCASTSRTATWTSSRCWRTSPAAGAGRAAHERRREQRAGQEPLALGHAVAPEDMLDKLTRVQRWQYDAEQLPLLGVALYPTSTMEPNHLGGLCYAIQAWDRSRTRWRPSRSRSRAQTRRRPDAVGAAGDDGLPAQGCRRRTKGDRTDRAAAGGLPQGVGVAGGRAGRSQRGQACWKRPEVSKENADGQEGAGGGGDRNTSGRCSWSATITTTRLKKLEKDSEASMKKVKDSGERSAKEELLATRKEACAGRWRRRRPTRCTATPTPAWRRGWSRTGR